MFLLLSLIYCWLVILSSQLSYKEPWLKQSLLLLLKKPFQVDFSLISFQHKFCPTWRNSAQCKQVHKAGNPIFIQWGAAYLCTTPPVNQETTTLKALKLRAFLWNTVVCAFLRETSGSWDTNFSVWLRCFYFNKDVRPERIAINLQNIFPPKTTFLV